MSAKSQNAIATSPTRRKPTGPYLPRGLRQRLADHFHLTVSAIDWRLAHGHPETIAVAKDMMRRDHEKKLQDLLKKQRSKLQAHLELRLSVRIPGKDQLTFLEDLREDDRA